MTFTPSGIAAATRDYSLAEGDIDVEDCSIECWKHGSAFSLQDGSPQSLPATQPVPVYEVHRGG